MRASLKAMSAWLLAILRMLLSVIGLRDVFMFGGMGVFAYGLHQVYPPSAWIAVGVTLMLLAARSRRSE